MRWRTAQIQTKKKNYCRGAAGIPAPAEFAYFGYTMAVKLTR